MRPLRDAARHAYRPRRPTAADLAELEREMAGLDAEKEGLADALAHVRARIRAAGSQHHRSAHVRSLIERHRSLGRGYSARDVYGEESERGYAELLEERTALLAHERHVRAEYARLMASWRVARRPRRRASARRQSAGLAGQRRR